MIDEIEIGRMIEEASAKDQAETMADPAAEKDEGVVPLVAREMGKVEDELLHKHVTTYVGVIASKHEMGQSAGPATAAPVRRAANRDVRSARNATPSWTRW